MEQIKVSIEILKNDATGDTVTVLKNRNLNDLASILVAFRREQGLCPAIATACGSIAMTHCVAGCEYPIPHAQPRSHTMPDLLL